MLNLTRILNGFSRRFGKVVFNVKLSNLVDSDVAPKSSYLSNWIRHMCNSTIELGNDNSVGSITKNTGKYSMIHMEFY